MAKIDCSKGPACCNEVNRDTLESSGIAHVGGAEMQLRRKQVANQAIAIRVYIAGPMRGIPYFNFPAFDEAAEVIRDYWGMTPVSPADMDRDVGFDAMKLPPDSDWTDAGSHGLNMANTIQRDIVALLSCDVVAMLPGWEKSRGAKAEMAVAEWAGLRVLQWSPRWDDQNPIPLNMEGIAIATPPSPAKDDRDILDIASEITRGDRQATYGPPDQDFRRTAEMWSALKGVKFEPWEVAQFMIALKLSRETHQRKRDNAIDIAGYARCLDVCNKAAGVY